jgi:probable HAF family extracellular repeat protein
LVGLIAPRHELIHSAVWLASTFATLPAFAAPYSVINLGPGTVAGINASGQVLGHYAGGDSYIYNSSTNTFQDIGSFAARGINNLGQVCGNNGTHVVFYNGTVHDLGVPLGGGSPCKAYNLNDAGEITGQVGLPSAGPVHGFVYNPANPNNGGYTDLLTLSGNSADTCYGFSINSAGQIEGDSTASNGNTHAFIWTNGAMTDLNTLGGPDSSGIHVNDEGHATGTAQMPSSGTTPATWVSHIFLYTGTTLTDCGLLPGNNYGNAGGMNDFDMIVGYSIPNAAAPGADSRAVIYSNGMLTDLNTLIPANSGLTLLAGEGINDSDQIIANAIDSSGTTVGVLLNRVIAPEPGTLALMATGSGFVVCGRRSRRIVPRPPKRTPTTKGADRRQAGSVS